MMSDNFFKTFKGLDKFFYKYVIQWFLLSYTYKVSQDYTALVMRSHKYM